MTTVAEIDQAGRVVVPKKLRDALHLLPGTRLSLRIEGESIVMKADMPESSAYQKQGLWVYHSPETISAKEIREFMDRGRGEREGRILGKATTE